MNGLPARVTQRRAKRVTDSRIHEGVEAIITHLNRQRHDEGMVQTTHGFCPAAKVEVVSIILWFWVQIPVGPPISRSYHLCVVSDTVIVQMATLCGNFT